MTCNEEINFRDNSSIDQACELIEKTGNVSTIGMNCFSPLLVEKVIEKLKKNNTTVDFISKVKKFLFTLTQEKFMIRLEKMVWRK